ncbi:hypothetical protein TRFO_06663 [Tritrichomonas foetus]|uniref:PKD domain-containing protein n=1 Tax=Tritrichomonas foetus TaxID=1144522 RepID=A0A1J4JWB4_9EUKA|nr:hypothetical protein TRFO_06663 [Tritrichomonas foetus]|eukprot:OHT03433.1 hypothetical protein TRFO_06663 [Tritrichomonas foetus]
MKNELEMKMLFFCFFFLSKCVVAPKKIHINVGCFNGRQIKQYEPVIITIYPYQQETSSQSSYYYDFGDGSTQVTSGSYIQHIYKTSGQFNIRVVETDTNTNISSGGYIDTYAQTTIFVFPNERPFQFRFENNILNQDTYRSPMIEIPFGTSLWNLSIIDYTEDYFDSTITAILGTVDYEPEITTTNEDLHFTIQFNKTFNKYQVELTYIGTQLESFLIQVSLNFSLGPLLPSFTQFTVSTKIFEFPIKDSQKSIKNVKSIPYYGTGAVAMTENDNKLVITNLNFYMFSEMSDSVDDFCVSSNKLYYLKNDSIYSCDFINENPDFVNLNMFLNNSINFTGAKLFGSPHSAFRKSDEIDAPNQILAFTKNHLYRISDKAPSDRVLQHLTNISTNNLQTGLSKDITKTSLNDLSKNTDDIITDIPIDDYDEILFASAYLDQRVTIYVFKKGDEYFTVHIDDVIHNATKFKIPIENLYIAFLHDFTKNMIFINDKYIYVSSNLGVSVRIVYTLNNEIVNTYACSLHHDEVVVFTSEGKLVQISPELQIATVLCHIDVYTSIVFAYDLHDDLIAHINSDGSSQSQNLVIRIPVESLIDVISYSFPGSYPIFTLKEDKGDTLLFTILDGDQELPSYEFDFSHLSLFGKSEECRFITKSSECQIVAFDHILQQYQFGGIAQWSESNNTAKIQLNIEFFTMDMIGMTCSIPNLNLIFTISQIESSFSVRGELFRYNSDLSSSDFDFFRLFDLREKKVYIPDIPLIVDSHKYSGQQIMINNTNRFEFDSSMIGMSLYVNNEFYPILRVTDNNIAFIIHKKSHRPLKPGIYDKWSITWDDILSTHDLLKRKWSLRYALCDPVYHPDYYPIVSIFGHTTYTIDINISESTEINTKLVANEHFPSISTMNPYNASFSLETPTQDYSLSTFVLTLRDSSPKCKHTYIFGLSSKCTNDIRFLATFDSLSQIEIPFKNYRPPTKYGLKIATSPHIYNYDPTIKENDYKDRLKMSKDNFGPKQCINATTLEDCTCQEKLTREMDIYYTDCIQTAYKVSYGIPITSTFILQTFIGKSWITTSQDFIMTIEEINGRQDLCIGKKCEINSREMHSIESFFVTGTELYHFKFSVNVSGCMYTKYAVFWCDGNLLHKSYVYLIMSSVLLACILVIEIIYYSIKVQDKTRKND